MKNISEKRILIAFLDILGTSQLGLSRKVCKFLC